MPTRAIDLTTADIPNALLSFCFDFATPPLIDEMHVISGFTNNRSLPTDSNDYCVITPIMQRRSGTDIVHYEREGRDVEELREYVEVDAQIDCYSKNKFDAMKRAQTYETVCRSPYGVDHFAKYDVDCLYSDSSNNLTAVIDDANYVSRWTLVIHLGYWKRVELAQEFFNTAKVNVVNVDTRFKP